MPRERSVPLNSASVAHTEPGGNLQGARPTPHYVTTLGFPSSWSRYSTNDPPQRRGGLKQQVVLLKIALAQSGRQTGRTSVPERTLVYTAVLFQFLGLPSPGSLHFNSSPSLPPPSSCLHSIPTPKIQFKCCLLQEAFSDPHRMSESIAPSLGLPCHYAPLPMQLLKFYFVL